MAVLPDTDLLRVQFAEAHTAGWTSNAAAIGLTGPQVTAIVAAAAAARTAFNTQQTAKNAAKAATSAFHASAGTMTDLLRVAIAGIKLKAESLGGAAGQAVYDLAQIPAPSAPTPPGVPDAPTMLTADPNADGTITLSWKGSTAFQTFFNVWRRVGASGEWTPLGATAVKKFLDAGVPSGVASLSYRVTAQRQADVSAPSVEATVNFGSGGGEGLFGAAGSVAFVGPGEGADASPAEEAA